MSFLAIGSNFQFFLREQIHPVPAWCEHPPSFGILPFTEALRPHLKHLFHSAALTSRGLQSTEPQYLRQGCSIRHTVTDRQGGPPGSRAKPLLVVHEPSRHCTCLEEQHVDGTCACPNPRTGDRPHDNEAKNWNAIVALPNPDANFPMALPKQTLPCMIRPYHL
jgi:hypothetical protein